MLESGAYLAYVSIYSASKVQKEVIRTILQKQIIWLILNQLEITLRKLAREHL